MGRALAENFASARDVFEEADRALGFPLSKLCFEGPAEELQLTANTQPSILAVSVAAAEVLGEQGVRADFVAGHSLGEYSALVVAGAILADVRRCGPVAVHVDPDRIVLDDVVTDIVAAERATREDSHAIAK